MSSTEHLRPAGPREWPLLGSLPSFGRDPLGFLVAQHRAYGDTVAFTLGSRRMWLLADPEDIEDLLVKNWRSFHKDRVYEELKAMVGTGLVTSEDELWKRQRRMAAPSFQPRQIRAYAEAMVVQAEALAAGLTDGEVRDIHGDMMHVTMKIVLETLFGSDADLDYDLVTGSIETFMVEGFSEEVHGVRALVPGWVPTPGRARVRRAIQALDDALMPFIQQRRASGEARDDLLGRLLAAADEDGSQMSNRQLRDEVVTVFVAGHETTALALTYAWILLSEHPEARARLEAEVDDVVGDREVTLDDLANLPFGQAVLQESMRLYPPAWTVGREAVEDVQIGRWHIEKGDQVIASPYVNHRDPRWFEVPDTFRPERWLDGLEKRLPRFAYFPFGGGPRVCIGHHFAMMEARLLLATLARHASFAWTGEPALELIPSVTLRPKHPVRVRVTRRR